MCIRDSVIPRVYVAGWIKRGPSGVVGTNKPDAIEPVGLMLEDLQSTEIKDPINGGLGAVPDLLRARGVRFVSFDDWKYLNEMEVQAGKKVGKPREKMTTVTEMISALDKRG